MVPYRHLFTIYRNVPVYMGRGTGSQESGILGSRLATHTATMWATLDFCRPSAFSRLVYSEVQKTACV